MTTTQNLVLFGLCLVVAVAGWIGWRAAGKVVEVESEWNPPD